MISRRFGNSVAVAFCLMAGVVFAEFNKDAVATAHLVRPLLVCALLAVVVGAVCQMAGRYAVPVAAGAGLLIAKADLVSVLLVSILAVVILILRIARKDVDLSKPLTALTVVFLVSGVALAVPHIRVDVEPPPPPPDRPTYLILVDGYPRVDTLAQFGIDNTDFISALEQRGFDHYPDARTDYGWTHLTLAQVLGSTINYEDDWGSAADRRRVWEWLRLPEGFVVVGSSSSHTVIADAKDIGPGGITGFDVAVLSRSAFAPLVGDLVMDGLRRRLEGSLEALATTDEELVFAHLAAPHLPFLYTDEGKPAPAPKCWPRCQLFDVVIERVGLATDDWVDGMTASLNHLNPRLLEAVDSILERKPEATIVLFSDHGARYSLADPDEWHRSFLAARTPEHPALFADRPTPAGLLERLP